MENIKKEFGARIKSLRNLRGFAQEQLAEKAGLSAKTISYIERGKNTIAFLKLPLLAEALQVPVYKLFVMLPEDADRKTVITTLLDSATDKEINAAVEVLKVMFSLK